MGAGAGEGAACAPYRRPLSRVLRGAGDGRSRPQGRGWPYRGRKESPFQFPQRRLAAISPLAELRKKFADAGVQPGDTVAAYCHVGQQATVVMLGARLLGHPVRLYDGSMNDWETRKLPLENPTAPKPPEQVRK